jgi:hypothetical protein
MINHYKNAERLAVYRKKLGTVASAKRFLDFCIDGSEA